MSITVNFHNGPEIADELLKFAVIAAKCNVKLFYADVSELDTLLSDMEIGEIILSDMLPEKLIYPAIQSYLFEKVREKI